MKDNFNNLLGAYMENKKFPIYSIGHGGRTIETFLNLLKEYQIDFLIDVRTNPFSRFHSHFNKEYLEEYCKRHSIRYLFLGDDLGGKPKDRSCYDEEGHILYDNVMEKDFFIRSANRLITAYKKNLRVACMCSELKPCECHRSKMIGRYLSNQNIEMSHIDENGNLISQKSVMTQIDGGYETDLFGEKFEFKSIGAY
ncbi:DUF488 family protein [Avibacterium avium]|uniref:DUF488 domain-containing protein n=1 Tax=Avibacterium avium TaxID=751 RepID=UPI003BF7FE61